nr:hypothetical protein [uncultured Acinetobacter sp.]
MTEILLGFGLNVKNNGKDAYCRVSKTLLPEGKTVSIQYDSKDEKALAKRNFAQLNEIAGKSQFQFTDLTISTGGSSGGIEVIDLDLNQYALKVQSTMKTTSDIQQNIIGSSTNGLLVNSNEAILSGYFGIGLGQFTFTLDHTRTTAVLVLRPDEPEESILLQDMTDEMLLLAAMYMMGSVSIIITKNITSQPLLMLTISNTVPLEAITVKITKPHQIDVYNKNTLIGSYTHDQEIGSFIQTGNFPEGFVINEFAFDLLNAYESLEFVVPEHVKEGVYYHLKSDAVLLEKELKKDDFISFFNDKSEIMIIRVEDVPAVPEPTINEYYRGQFDSINLLMSSITNPKNGDYAIIKNSTFSGFRNTLCFYSAEESDWKPLLTETNYRGTYPYLPYIDDAKPGDFIIVGYDENMNIAFFHPYLSMFVEIKPKNTDSILEGNVNKYYADSKVVELFIRLFITNFSENPGFKSYFDSYINTLLNSEYFAQNNNLMAQKATIAIHSEAKANNTDFQLFNMKRSVNQLSYESFPNGFISPTDASANGAFDLFDFDPIPFDIYKGFWVINFEVVSYAQQDARLQIGVMFNGGQTLDYADLHYADMTYTASTGSLETVFYGNNNSAFTNNQPMRFSIGYKHGTTYIIDLDGKWKGLGIVQSQHTTHNNVKFFIRKFYGKGISIRNVHASFGEVMQLPNIS